MRRGKKDHLLNIEKPGRMVSDGQQRRPGGYQSVVKGIAAQFVPKLGKEEYRQDEQRGIAPALFRFDYDPCLEDLDNTWRVWDGSQHWDVVAFTWDGRTNSTMEIQVTRQSQK